MNKGSDYDIDKSRGKLANTHVKDEADDLDRAAFAMLQGAMIGADMDKINQAKKYGIMFIPDPHPNQVPLNEIKREVEDTTYEEVKPNLLGDGSI